MREMLESAAVLIVEDGDEYRDNLARFVPGPRYLQAHGGAEALEILSREEVDLVYLDMRFDRIPREHLLGDHAAVTREQNGDPVRAWRYLENNQGLFILDAMRRAGFGDLPVILAYDFSREAQRFTHLQRLYPSLTWIADAVTPAEIREAMEKLLVP
jgi:CheY-like chemotaxis protein